MIDKYTVVLNVCVCQSLQRFQIPTEKSDQNQNDQIYNLMQT